MPPSFTIITFLDGAPPDNLLEHIKNRDDEEIALGSSEIYVYYKQGMSKSKLKIPAADEGTARNLTTMTKLLRWRRRLKSDKANDGVLNSKTTHRQY